MTPDFLSSDWYRELFNVVYASCLVLPCVLARWVPTDHARELAEDVRETLDYHYPRKVSSELLGLKESDLSEQLHCTEPLNFYRLSALFGTPFWNALLKRMARRVGGEYLDPTTCTLLAGAAHLKRPVLSMRDSDRKRSA